MNKTLLSLVLVALIAAPLTAFGNVGTVHAAGINTAIRGQSQQTVYWYANDGKRYVFPNAATYFTWFASFNSVQNISDAELFTIPLGGNVTYRPGSKLVKVTTDPKVYAIARGGILRHITSASLATQLYGSNWGSKIQDIPDSFFGNYTIGAPIYSTSDYNVSNEYNGVFNPNDSLRTQSQNVTNQTGSLTLSADRTSITSGQAVYLTGTYSGTLPSGSYLEIKDVRNNNTVKTCFNTSVCTVTVYPSVDSAQNSAQYYIVAKNGNGTHIATQYAPVIYFIGSSYQAGTFSLTSIRTSITSGEQITLTAYATQNLGNRYIIITNQQTGTVVGTCYNTYTCVKTTTVTGYNGQSIRFNADYIDANNGMIVDGNQVTVYVNADTYDAGSTQSVSTIGGQVPNTDIFISPAYNIRAGGTVNFTASFTNLPFPSTDTVIRMYTEQSGTPVGTCTRSVSCSIPYTISNGGVNTRVYGVANNNSLTNTRETAHIQLTTF